MQEKTDLIVGLESILCLVANNTWDGKKFKTLKLYYIELVKRYYQRIDIDNL